ncbi:MAG: hypothetical protein JRI55_18270 [Deltaproteobacteria bacterium]|nr:hypothetical protein [Deltaproteobacteria bacterium]
MHVKGTAFIARQIQVSEQFGEDAWRAFIEDLANEHHYFEDAIYPTSKIPLAIFLKVQDRIIERFYGGDEEAHRRLGYRAAEWALTRGPMESLLEERGDKRQYILDIVRKAWRRYFDFGDVTVAFEGDDILLTIVELPLSHQYFERSIAGYLEKTMSLMGAERPACEVVPTNSESSVLFRCNPGGWRELSTPA